MKHPKAFALFAVFVAGFNALSPSAIAQPTPLANAHAHNDYEHPRPLLDALDHGFCSVEADIYLIDGQLLVAHDRDKVQPQRTLQALYLDPLRERVRKNGGRVFPNGPAFTLLVDIKSDAEKTYSALRDVLQRYADMLTEFRPDATETKAVTVIISGNRPKEMMAAEPRRYAGMDGRLSDLKGPETRHFIPLISDNWGLVFKWRGSGALPEEERQRLKQFVSQAHEQGRRIRFWAAPDNAASWRELRAAGVDLINTDNLAGLETFLLEARVSVEPQETGTLLANPGMGWQTFHTLADEDRHLQGLPSSSAYFRFYWREIEPKDGAIDFARLDALLAQARKAGQKLAFRIMCTGSGQFMDVPQWLKDQGCKGYDFEYGGSKHWVPDFEESAFQKAHLRLIRELGRRYGDHPDLDLVDIGSVGLWGEWHMSGTKRLDTGQPVPLPSLQTRLAIIDAWRQAFPAKPKVMLIGDMEGMRHAIENGCGWRADCLGDMGGFSKNWNHMRDLYPQHVQQTGAAEAWQKAPVAFESCWEMGKWKREGWDIRHIFDFALAYHASYLNNKSAPIPEGTRSEIERFLRHAGYRIVLRKVEHDRQLTPGASLPVSMLWENVGVAPPYSDYFLALRLLGTENKEQKAISTTVTSIHGWLPGKKEIVAALACPKDLQPGRYQLAVALVDPVTRAPAIQLAIAGRAPDGWYPLSQVEIRPAP